jgi:positive regulator of sigma E activity
MWALNPLKAKVGDEVVVELLPSSKILGTTLIFIFPLTGMFLGYLTGAYFIGGRDYPVLGSVLGLVCFFLLVRLWDKVLSKKRKFQPEITEVLS